MRALALPVLPVLLAACSQAPDQPGQVDADDTQALNEAAEMLDANSVDLNAVTNGGTATGDDTR